MKRLLEVLCVTGAVLAPDSLAPVGARADSYFECNIDMIVEWTQGSEANIAVHCTADAGIAGVRWLAVPPTAPHANRFLSLAQAAYLSGRKFYGTIPTNASAPCPNVDCRVPYQFGVRTN